MPKGRFIEWSLFCSEEYITQITDWLIDCTGMRRAILFYGDILHSASKLPVETSLVVTRERSREPSCALRIGCRKRYFIRKSEWLGIRLY